jgi:pimeloyl-ACP methyl ester carboxylesterase
MGWYGPKGRQVYFEQDGQGDTVVLLPGWAGSITDLDHLRRGLVSEFRVIAIDLPGSGRSQPQPRHYAPTYYHDDARTLLGLLAELRVETAHLVGFSDGGEVALLMAAQQSVPILSVLTWGAVGQIVAAPGMLDGLANLLDDPTDRFKSLAAYLAEKYGVEAARIMAKSWAQAMSTIIDAGGDVSRSQAASIRCPVLMIAGTHDPFCPTDLVREMAEAMPRGRYLEVPGAGHDIHLSHGGWLNSKVSGWLGSH